MKICKQYPMRLGDATSPHTLMRPVGDWNLRLVVTIPFNHFYQNIYNKHTILPLSAEVIWVLQSRDCSSIFYGKWRHQSFDLERVICHHGCPSCSGLHKPLGWASGATQSFGHLRQNFGRSSASVSAMQVSAEGRRREQRHPQWMTATKGCTLIQ